MGVVLGVVLGVLAWRDRQGCRWEEVRRKGVYDACGQSILDSVVFVSDMPKLTWNIKSAGLRYSDTCCCYPCPTRTRHPSLMYAVDVIILSDFQSRGAIGCEEYGTKQSRLFI